VVEIEGEVRERPEQMRNEEIETGNIEIKALSLKIFPKPKLFLFLLTLKAMKLEKIIVWNTDTLI